MGNGSRVISPVSRTRLRLAGDERLVASIRQGDAPAFEALYERHARGLMSFCIYMLGSRHDAEDAIQATFAAAHRSLLADDRPVAVRPWLFAIARNECIGILRKRRPTAELNGEPAKTGDPVRQLELSEEVRSIVKDVRQLPERQRAALVLAEVDGLSHGEIATVLGVRAEQVKAYMYQARANLISERRAREADCLEIRQELAAARGAAIRRARIRRHTRSCVACRAYADSVKRQHHKLTALLPITPTLGVKYRILEQLFGIGAADPATYAGGAAVGSTITAAIAELAGGGIKALAVKLAAGALALGATAEVGASMLKATGPPPGAAQSASVEAPRSVTNASTLGVAPAKSGTGGAGASVYAHASHPAAGSQPPAGSPGQEATAPGAATPAPNEEAPDPRSEGERGHGGNPHGTPGATPPAGSSEPQHAGSSGEQWQGASALRHGEHERERAERVRAREERRAAHKPTPSEGSQPPGEEEPPEVGLSGSPKRTPQERQERREEHERRHKEHEERLAAGE